MYYIIKIKDGKCDPIEGYTDNEFIFRQYIRMIQYIFREVNYDAIMESLSEEEVREKYGFNKNQRFRIYSSFDKSTHVYCNPLFMCDWLGCRNARYTIFSSSDATEVMDKFLHAAINVFQLMKYIIPEKRDDYYDLFRRLLIYAVQAVDNRAEVIDTIKLMAYMNKCPRDLEF